jgi:hypothetical protein
MNCDTARNRILGLPDPAAVPAPLSAHLDDCPACRAWHQLLTRVDGAIAATAPPASSGRAKRKLIEQFRGAAAATAQPAPKARPPRPAPVSVPTVQPATAKPSIGERLARLWPASVVAAAVLVGVLVWASFRGKSETMTVAAPRPDPFLEKVVLAKVKLDTAPDAAARLAVLDSLGADIHGEARTLSMVTPGAEMDSLARLYEQVVTDGLVEQARGLDANEKRTKLPLYVEHLRNAEQEANQWAAEAPPGSDRPLREIAKAAARGRTELSRMLQG